MRPNILNHELMHQWNSFLNSSLYWLIDPSFHTGLVEEGESCFENNRNTFEHVQNNIYSYRQYSANGFAGQLEGYLAGLWDMPQNLRTLKNYFHDSSLPSTNMGDYYLVHVFADEIVDLTQTELFTMYGGERIPNYQNVDNDYDCVVVVFSLENFLDNNFTKGFHYSSVLNEFEEPVSEYNNLYDEVFPYQTFFEDPIYGRRQLNPYHASYKNLNFTTRLFDDVLTVRGNSLSEMVLYPNPTNGVVNIKIPEKERLVSVKLYDIQGSLINKSNGLQINITDLNSGLYFIEIRTNIGMETLKIVKR